MTPPDAHNGVRSTNAAARSMLLSELLACIQDGYLTFCGDEDQLAAVLMAVDFEEPFTVRRAAGVVNLWRRGGDAA